MSTDSFERISIIFGITIASITIIGSCIIYITNMDKEASLEREKNKQEAFLEREKIKQESAIEREKLKAEINHLKSLIKP